MIDSPFFKEFDWTLIALLLLNSAIGVVIIYSASHYLPGNMYLKQILWIIVSLIAFILLLSVDYKILVTHSVYFYFICLVILTGVQFFGKIVAGATRWIKFSFFQAQPSEITKIIVILILARVFSQFKEKYLSWNRGFLTGIIVALPFVLIALQPDLGTAFTFLPILLGALLLAGLNRKFFIYLIIFALLGGVCAWNFLLRDYQKERLMTLVSPGHDPLGAGYHILQSKIAIGSGGFFGKGYIKGTQSQLRFLPARHTDFIFSVIGEEFGFIGIVVIFFFYFLLLLRLFQSVKKSRDRAGMYITFMVSGMIAFQFFVNVMVVVGLFPVTGIPLPFISYGGSSLLANYLGASLVMNVTMRRFVNV